MKTLNVLLVAATEAEAAVFTKAAVPGAGRNTPFGQDDSPERNGFSGQDGISQQGDFPGRSDFPERERDDFPGGDGISDGYVMGNLNLSILVTGIGSTATAWALTRRLCTGPRPDLVINAGIAGSFRDSLKTGDVVMPVSDCFSEGGVENA